MNFSDAQREALAFRDERDWRQFHNAKDLAISISLEAAELLECFQWSGADLNPSLSRERMREELADVMMYCIYFADSVGIDIPSALHDKILRNAEHYPVDKAARVALSAIAGYLGEHTEIERVRMVCFDSRTKRAYEEALGEL